MVNAKFETTAEYFHYHFKRCGRFHTVTTTLTPHRWRAYGSTDYEWYSKRRIKTPYHREVLPNEVVIDIDTKDETIRDEAVKQITDKLRDEGKCFSVWRTGGKGIHIHTYWKQLNKLTSEDRKEMKKLIIHHYCYGLIDRAGIDMQLAGRHMVRAEHGRHENTGRYKNLLVAENELVENETPSVVVDRLIKVLDERKQWKPSQRVPNGETPECIRFMMSDDFRTCKDGRKRAMFALCSWFKSQGKTVEEIVEAVEKINHYQWHDYISKQTIITTAKASTGRVSCRYRHELLEEMKKKDVIETCNMKRGK